MFENTINKLTGTATEAEGQEIGDEIVMERDPVTGVCYQIINGERVPV